MHRKLILLVASVAWAQVAAAPTLTDAQKLIIREAQLRVTTLQLQLLQAEIQLDRIVNQVTPKDYLLDPNTLELKVNGKSSNSTP